MSHTPNYDAKIKAILDATKPGERVCGLTGEKWEMTEEEIFWYKKFNVPPSVLSPSTRWKQHSLWLVGFQFWYQRHPKTQKSIIGIVHPATGLKMLPDQEWLEQDYSKEARDYSLKKPFFEQWRELQLSVPFPTGHNHIEPKNSITFGSQGDEDSFFVGTSKTRQSMYCHFSMNIENSIEVYESVNIQESYSIVHSHRIFNCQFVRESSDCLNASFLFDCRNCEYCFGATNKRNRKYLWWNEQLSKEEWEKLYANVNLELRKEVEKNKQQFDELIKQAIWPENFNEKTDRCIGEYLTNCLDCRYVYYGDGGARNNYWVAWTIGKSEGNAFCADPSRSQECYLCSAAQRCFHCLYSAWISRCQHVEYCNDCYDCEYCFGCVGLRRKKFCVFNKPYSEEEYWQLVDTIKTQMLQQETYGEFFPAKFSAGYFPESGAVKYYLADISFGEKIGANLFDPDSCGAIGEDLMNTKEVRMAFDIPDTAQALEGWAGVPIYDPSIDRRFSFLGPEILFYQKNHLAPPCEHHIKRVRDLIWRSNSGVFESATCEQCGKTLIVAKNQCFPQRRIYCKECYLNYLEKEG